MCVAFCLMGARVSVAGLVGWNWACGCEQRAGDEDRGRDPYTKEITVRAVAGKGKAYEKIEGLVVAMAMTMTSPVIARWM